jgi:Zn-finger nucleic acid-binding protein
MKLCPDCYMGRVDKSGRKPYKLNSEFKDCPKCKGTGVKK